jgi:uncharacterized membrane protein YphA (DoxX/SURF4 family)
VQIHAALAQETNGPLSRTTIEQRSQRWRARAAADAPPATPPTTTIFSLGFMAFLLARPARRVRRLLAAAVSVAPSIGHKNTRRVLMERSDPDLYLLHPGVGLAARVMFTLIFFASGITHFTDLAGYVALMPESIPWRPFWVVISAVVELAGAAMILANRYPRLGGWLIAIFLVPVTVVVHGVAMATATDPRMQQIQVSFFLKGVTMTGGALLITQLEAGERRRR